MSGLSGCPDWPNWEVGHAPEELQEQGVCATSPLHLYDLERSRWTRISPSFPISVETGTTIFLRAEGVSDCKNFDAERMVALQKKRGGHFRHALTQERRTVRSQASAPTLTRPPSPALSAASADASPHLTPQPTHAALYMSPCMRPSSPMLLLDGTPRATKRSRTPDGLDGSDEYAKRPRLEDHPLHCDVLEFTQLPSTMATTPTISTTSSASPFQMNLAPFTPFSNLRATTASPVPPTPTLISAVPQTPTLSLIPATPSPMTPINTARGAFTLGLRVRDVVRGFEKMLEPELLRCMPLVKDRFEHVFQAAYNKGTTYNDARLRWYTKASEDEREAAFRDNPLWKVWARQFPLRT